VKWDEFGEDEEHPFRRISMDIDIGLEAGLILSVHTLNPFQNCIDANKCNVDNKTTKLRKRAAGVDRLYFLTGKRKNLSSIGSPSRWINPS